MVSKAGLNSQSVNRLDALETSGGAELVGADTANGLAGTTVQQQINELAEAASGGGGNAMKVVGRQIETIPAATPAGTLLTATAVGDKQRLRIRVLGTTGSLTETGMTVSIDGFDYINNGGLGGLAVTPAAGNLLVTPSPRSAADTIQNVPLLYNEIVCKTFTLTKVSSNTSQIINCAYDILEPLE